VDPLFKSYPWNATYSYAEGSPIENLDMDGLEKLDFKTHWAMGTAAGNPAIGLGTYVFDWFTSGLVTYAEATKNLMQNEINYANAKEQTRNIDDPGLQEAIDRTHDHYQAMGYIKAAEGGLDIIDKSTSVIGGLEAGAVIATAKVAVNAGTKKAVRTAMGESDELSRHIWEGKASNKYSSAINPSGRAEMLENAAQHTIFKEYQYIGNLDNGYFPVIDFWKNGIGASFKTTQAKRGSEFLQAIMNNIDQLANIRAKGVVRGKRDAFSIKNVRLDIAVPRGYNIENLTDVINHAKAKGVDYSIHVMPK
jgi:hypothetical protein